MTNTTQTRNQLEREIASLDEKITNHYYPKGLRPIALTALSATPLVLSLGVHAAIKYISPENYSPEAAIVNHFLASGICLAYNSLSALNGEFKGLARRFKEYNEAERKLTNLREKLEALEKFN
jgi:hypothetical protein